MYFWASINFIKCYVFSGWIQCLFRIKRLFSLYNAVMELKYIFIYLLVQKLFIITNILSTIDRILKYIFPK